jgi:hypothetical protein
VFLHYFYWQFVVAPLWLLRFFVTLQQALLQAFSVRLMLRTLFAHWRKDRLSLQQGTIGRMVNALALNAISRVIGFCVRSIILLVWLALEAVFLIFATSAWGVFIILPIFALVCLAWGVALFLQAFQIYG